MTLQERHRILAPAAREAIENREMNA